MRWQVRAEERAELDHLLGATPRQNRQPGQGSVRSPPRIRKTATGGGCPPPRNAPGATPRPLMEHASKRMLPACALLDDNLPVHPRVWCTDVVLDTRLVEGDGLCLARGQNSGIPTPDLAVFKRRRRVRRVADIGEGHRGPRLDSGASRKVGILDVVVADLDRVDALSDWSGRTGDGR